MSEATERSERFDRYLGRLTGVIGHADRHEPLKKYCVGLLLPSETNKSVEPMAARISPNRVSAEHQSLLHFVGQAPWSDAKVLRVARQWALPEMERHGPIDVWIIDESGIPKKGKCSVGVANQYCGQLGKNANSQVMVSVSVANDEASLPVAHRLYLPQAWADDPKRRKDAHVPEDAVFARKWEIALDLIDGLLAEEPEVPRGTVAADAVYGDCFAFRNGLTKRGVPYAVHVSKTTLVWPQGKRPQPAEYSGKGRPPKGLRRTKEHQPVSVLDLARSLPERKWTAVTWREGTDGDQTSRFAALRVRPAREGGEAGAAPPPGVAAHRVARGRGRAHQVLAVHRGQGHPPHRADPQGQAALAHRARLPGPQAGVGLRRLPGPWVAGIPPPHNAMHRRLRLPPGRAGRAFPPEASHTTARRSASPSPWFPTPRIPPSGLSGTSPPRCGPSTSSWSTGWSSACPGAHAADVRWP